MPRESLRLVRFNHRACARWPAGWSITVIAGEEWRQSLSVVPALLVALGITQMREIYEVKHYGLVLLDGRKMASRTGREVLIDDLLDTVRESAATRPEIPGHLVDAAAAIALKSYLLSVPRGQAIEFSTDRLLREDANPGWGIAAAWAGLGAPAAEPSAVPEACVSTLREAVDGGTFDEVIALAMERREVCADPGASPEARGRAGRELAALLRAIAIVAEPSNLELSRVPSLVELNDRGSAAAG